MSSDERNSNAEPEAIEVPRLDYVDVHRHRRVIKEVSAKSIAISILSIFGILVFGTLATNFFIIWRIPVETAPDVYISITTANFKSLGGLSSAVFAPLLAFILGYYFSEKQRR